MIGAISRYERTERYQQDSACRRMFASVRGWLDPIAYLNEDEIPLSCPRRDAHSAISSLAVSRRINHSIGEGSDISEDAMLVQGMIGEQCHRTQPP